VYVLPYRLVTVLGLASSECDLNVSRSKLTKEKTPSFTLSGPKAGCPPGPGIAADSKRHCPGQHAAWTHFSQLKKLTVQAKESNSASRESKISVAFKWKW